MKDVAARGRPSSTGSERSTLVSLTTALSLLLVVAVLAAFWLVTGAPVTDY